MAGYPFRGPVIGSMVCLKAWRTDLSLWPAMNSGKGLEPPDGSGFRYGLITYPGSDPTRMMAPLVLTPGPLSAIFHDKRADFYDDSLFMLTVTPDRGARNRDVDASKGAR
jgi:hypothetical protein